ncbi:MAG: SDR family NAD(P)-dependent oxidoreductase [Candidatus Xenobium sp.]
MRPEITSNPSTPLALVGMGCMFPRAGNRQEFWRVLRRGEDCITEVPPTHWSAADWFDGDPTSPDRTYSRVGGFLEPYPFDPTEFNLPPNSLEATDTSQLLALVGAKAALEDAGYGPKGRPIPKERTSVILGVTGTLELVVPLGARLGHPHWRRALREAGVDPETSERVVRRISESYVPWQEASFPGLLGNVVAGRIANRLDLHGTNCVVDAACASSLAAIHLAAAELSSGRSDLVLTGGVDTFNDVFMFMCFSKTPALSSEGSIRPFSDDSDGTLLGEGVGIVVLKRLADAELDGDRIYAVLTGMGTSSDGGGGAIYAPDASGQRRALVRAYEQAGVQPRSIELVEAHGTGTKVGDLVEFESLRSVYAEDSRDLQWCALGTVKSQIGHAKAAAGAASLCKAALALHHKVLPPTLKIRRPNPKLGVEQSPFYLNTETRPWLSPIGHPRRAALSSFGFGGSNFHMVLEEHGSHRQAPAWDGSVQILAVSGATREAVADRLEELSTGRPDTLSWRADQSRRNFRIEDPWRALVVAPPSEVPARLIGAAEALRAGRELPPDCFAGGPEATPGQIAFLFPGQGSQYVGMSRALATVFPEMLESLENTEALLPPEQAPAGRIFPRPAFDEETLAEQKQELTRTEVAQPALGAVEVGMLGVLGRFGLRPDAVAGHSFGELVALHAAGRLEADDLIRLSALRGHLMSQANQGQGSMLAVQAPLEEIAALAAETGVVLANRNHPLQGVLSGTREALARAEAICQERNWQARPLEVSAAFHSPLLESTHEPFAEALAKLPFLPGTVPVYANASAKPYPEEPEACRTLLADQLLSPVDFVGIVENLYAAGVRTFLEVGPKAVLTGLVRTILAEREHRTLSLEARGTNNGLENLARVLAELAALGVPVHLDRWEEPASEPRPKKMEVSIVGANYRSPQSRPTPPWEEPKRPAPGYEPAPPFQAPLPATHQVGAPHHPMPSPAPQQSAPAPMPWTAPPAHTRTAPPASPPTQGWTAPPPVPPAPTPEALSEAFRTIQEGLSAMQALQQQTTAAHQRFLEGQEQVQRVFHSLLAGQQRLAEATMGVPSLSAPLSPAPLTPPPMAFAAPPPPPPMPPPAPPPMTLAAPPLPAASPAPPPPAPAPKPGDTGEGVTSTILAVVAEKTGYPLEMLNLGMDLEADLGIDSIKRVEILAAVEERLPNLKTITPDEIGNLRTLQQVADRLGSGVPAGGNGSARATHGDTPRIVLAVVAEKTGYPIEMLNLGMDLEADLGIDSIKRVEILAAVEERLPDLQTITPDEIGNLRTLEQVVQRLGQGPSETPEPSAAPTADIVDIVLAVVAEKTGYPLEMLNLGMDLEADLGIDSIKRVEILAAVEERLPNLKTITPDEIGNLRTLQQVVDRLGGPPSAPPRNGKTPARSGSVSEIVLAVVAEKTGYPLEMLDLDMDLEADLGIDSIKRVEILAAVEEHLPNLKAITPDEIGDLRTLRQVVERLGGGPEGGGPGGNGGGGLKAPAAPPATDQTTHPSDSGPVGTVIPSVPLAERRVLRMQACPPLAPGALPGGGTYLVVDDGDLAGALKKSLERRGATARVVPLPEAASAASKYSGEDLGGLILIMPRSPSGAWNPTSERMLKECFRIAASAAPALKSRPALLATISRLDGRFGFSGSGYNPVAGGLAGLPKVAALEWPLATCRALDVAPDWPAEEAAEAIATELSSFGPMEVGLSAGGRVTPVLVGSPIEDRVGIDLEEGAVVLVTGGARGVTADCARALAAAFRPTLVLLGRSPEPGEEPADLQSAQSSAELKATLFQRATAEGRQSRPADLEREARAVMAAREIRQTLDQLQALGARAHYWTLDVRDAASVKAVVRRARRELGPIRGLIHAAGVLADRRIEDKTAEQFDSVFDTKVQGLRHLLAALKEDDLHFMAFFSSVTARFGRPGQSDYAMANEVMNKTARLEAERRPGTRVVALGWGPWDGGMVNDSLRREFEKIGVGLIPRDTGAASLVEELRRGAADEVEVILGSGFAQATPASEPIEIFQRSLDLETNPILHDHMLAGVPVLPMALMVEWLGEAACQGCPGRRLVGLDGLRVLRPVRIEDPAPTVRLLAGSPRPDGQNLAVPVELRLGEVLHARAEALLAQDWPQAPEIAPPEVASTPFPLQGEAAYRQFLFHGPRLQGLGRIQGWSERGLEATASRAPRPGEWLLDPPSPRWLADPLILDCALQTGLLWTGAAQDSPSLPLFGARYRQYRESFPAKVRLVFQVKSSSRLRLVGDVLFLDKDGLVASWSGLEWAVDPSLKTAFAAGSPAAR